MLGEKWGIHLDPRALSQAPVVSPSTLWTPMWQLCGPRGVAGAFKLQALSGPKSNKSQKAQSREKKNVLMVQFCPKGHLLLILLAFQAHSEKWAPGSTNRPLVEWGFRRTRRGKELHTIFCIYGKCLVSKLCVWWDICVCM